MKWERGWDGWREWWGSEADYNVGRAMDDKERLGARMDMEGVENEEMRSVCGDEKTADTSSSVIEYMYLDAASKFFQLKFSVS